MVLRRHVARTLAPLVTSFLAACLSVRTPRPGEPLRLEAGEALALGRVRVVERGIERHPWRVELSDLLAEDPVIHLALFHVESGKRKPDVPLDPEGRFAWILPAGTYLVYHTPSIEPPCNEPLAGFQLPAAAAVLDVGELVLDVSVDRPLGSELASYEVIGVEARPGDPESARGFLATRPEAIQVQPGTFVVDPRLGRLFDDWSVETCARILADHGVVLLP